MFRSPQTIREDMLAIWYAGVNGVRVDRLIRNSVQITDNTLRTGSRNFSLAGIDRIVVIGGGKASGAMAESLENILQGTTPALTGWVNVPADCAKPLRSLYLHPARPMGINEPTQQAVEGTQEIIRLAKSLTLQDLCICLISGGGSALLTAPSPDISLEEKAAMTRKMSAAGATIQEINAFRKMNSRIKGGKLAGMCRGKQLVSLILSDVLGDPLDVIASGPTIETNPSPLHTNIIIGNLTTAAEAAAEEARKRGYSVVTRVAAQAEGTAEEVGVSLVHEAMSIEQQCFISGGEPVVKLVSPERRGKGGRNQQLVLAALIHLLSLFNDSLPYSYDRLFPALLSGGTDGEDGPTDAAGAWIDPIFWEQFHRQLRENPHRQPELFLENNDAYHFFEPLGTLLKTGATGTNVCDLRVILKTN
ncbi:MAG: DUF4147 domain-containing protein [Planctomycetaceae bacterium]|jgi:hydroxypyruvate reductase|nr:DUF4147 domain-containing protein [Planctomycetaceae bacterium]